MTNDITSIQLKRSTKDILASLGSKGDTYDDIIRMLLLSHDENITFENTK